MNRRGAGMMFISISALLFSVKYISAAIYGSGSISWDEDLFQALLSYSGSSLHFLSMVSLVIGFLYIGWAEIEAIKSKEN